MDTILCDRKSTKNKWISTIIGKHYRNLHGQRGFGSRRSYGSSLYGCPCCCSLLGWKKAKRKRTRYDSHIQQLEGYADKDLFTVSSGNTMQWYVDAYDSRYNADPGYIDGWQCSQCTYLNFETSFCSMCMKAYDYNHQNNQNSFHYNDEHPLLIQYKPNKIDCSKRKNKKTRKHSNGNISSKKMTITEPQTNTTKNMENVGAEAVKYRLNKSNKNSKNRKIKMNKKKNVPVLIKEECLELVDIEISVVATKYNQYDYIQHKLFYNVKEDEFWMNVPMQLINAKLQRCFIKITPKNTQLQNAKLLYFEPLITNFFVPIYNTEYSFIFKHDSIPEMLQNRNLFKIIKHCLRQCRVKNVVLNRNISTNSFNLYPILFQYLPAMDILVNILFPLVGYNQAITIKTSVKNAQISKTNFIAHKNNEWNPIDDRYNSSLQHIIYKNQQQKPIIKKQLPDNQADDSDDQPEQIVKLFSDDDSDTCSDSSNSMPPFIKYLNGYTDDETGVDSDSVPVQKQLLDTSEKNMELENTANSLFKAPYKFCQYSHLLDDDPDRDKKWWQHVRYSKKLRSKRYKLGDKVKVHQWDTYWKDATVVQVTKQDITVNYSNGSEELISYRHWSKSIRLVSTCDTDKAKIVKDKIIERKRKAYSKANRNYFMANGR